MGNLSRVIVRTACKPEKMKPHYCGKSYCIAKAFMLNVLCILRTFQDLHTRLHIFFTF